MNRYFFVFLLILTPLFIFLALRRYEHAEREITLRKLRKSLFFVEMEVLKYKEERGSYPQSIVLIPGIDTLRNPVSGLAGYGRSIKEDTLNWVEGCIYYIPLKLDSVDTFQIFSIFEGKKIRP